MHPYLGALFIYVYYDITLLPERDREKGRRKAAFIGWVQKKVDIKNCAYYWAIVNALSNITYTHF